MTNEERERLMERCENYRAEREAARDATDVERKRADAAIRTRDALQAEVARLKGALRETWDACQKAYHHLDRYGVVESHPDDPVLPSQAGVFAAYHAAEPLARAALSSDADAGKPVLAERDLESALPRLPARERGCQVRRSAEVVLFAAKAVLLPVFLVCRLVGWLAGAIVGWTVSAYHAGKDAAK